MQTPATIGERGHRGVGGSADCLKASVDQRCDVRIGPRDGPEDLPASLIRLDIADASLEMTFTVIAAAYKGRVQGDGDRRRRRYRLDRGAIAKPLADFERMAAEGFGAPPGLHRQEMHQHASGDTIGHQGRKMPLQLIELRGRPTI